MLKCLIQPGVGRAGRSFPVPLNTVINVYVALKHMLLIKLTINGPRRLLLMRNVLVTR